MNVHAPNPWSAAPHDSALASDGLGGTFRPNSGAMNPEARSGGDRPCLEGSESRNRLSGGAKPRILASPKEVAMKHLPHKGPRAGPAVVPGTPVLGAFSS